jgi:hypothetical protein
MTVVYLINIKQDPTNKGYINGSVICNSTHKNYKDFDFKFYNNDKDIQSFNEGDVVTFIGTFCYCNGYDRDNSLFNKY